MRNDFAVLADSIDVTSRLSDRLLSMRITDEAGRQADVLEISLDDRSPHLEMPSTGAALEVSLGQNGALTQMGRFVVDEVTGGGAPDTLTIRAAAADMTGAVRAPRTQAYSGQNIAAIVRQIAARHGLSAAVGEAIGNRFISYTAQTAESDLHFLTRLVGPFGGVAKIAGGRLIVTRRGAAEQTNGLGLIAARVSRNGLQDFSWSISAREQVETATASWHDQAGGQRQTVSAGSGEPSVELRHVFATESEALRAAEEAVAAGSRQLANFSCGLSRFRPDLFAEAPIDLDGVRDGIDGRWVLTRVEHILKGELTSRIDAERPLPASE